MVNIFEEASLCKLQQRVIDFGKNVSINNVTTPFNATNYIIGFMALVEYR